MTPSVLFYGYQLITMALSHFKKLLGFSETPMDLHKQETKDDDLYKVSLFYHNNHNKISLAFFSFLFIIFVIVVLILGVSLNIHNHMEWIV